MPKTTRSGVKPPADLWNQMDALAAGAGLIADEIPEGAFTAREVAERYGVSFSTASLRLGALVKAGKVNSGNRLIGRRWTRHYWPA